MEKYKCKSVGIVGSGIQGGRTFGSYSDLFYGEPLDLQTGEVFSRGQEITPKILGATILALGDVDPLEFIGLEGITGMIS